MVKTGLNKTIIFGLFLFILVIIYSNYIKEAKTEIDNFVMGWGWIGANCTEPNETSCGATTSPVGWISLNSNNPGITCRNINYGVRINNSTGEISGSAWIGIGENNIYNDCNTNENTLGWLYFDSNDTPSCGQDGYPSDYCFPAKVVGNEVQGWAPIISKDNNGQQIIVTWVRFKGSNYRVFINNDKLEGYAWSGWGKDGGLGWIKFLGILPLSLSTLNVKSSPITNILITASDPQFSGLTNYTKTSTTTISTSLTAPQIIRRGSNSYIFNNWVGCDSTSNNICNVSINNGETQEVEARYVFSSPSQNFDLSVTSLDIRSFICKNKEFDSSFLDEYLSRNPDYKFTPSTTYASQFYNEVAKDTCPESQRNRPVEFSAKGECLQGNCPPSKLIIEINSNSPITDRETIIFETSFDLNYPKVLKQEYVFDKPYDYTVRACLVHQNGQSINDRNDNNNCKVQTVRIFDYMCVFGFCSQMQRDINNPSSIFDFEPFKYRILQTFGTHDLPCRYYRNEICRARFGF